MEATKSSAEKKEQEIQHDYKLEGDQPIITIHQKTWAEQFRALWACKRAVLAALACASGAVLIGYDMTLIGSIIANPEFVKRFGVYDETTKLWSLPADVQLIWSVVQYISAMVGAIASGHLNDILGRRTVFHILVGCTMVGTIVELFSPDWKIWNIAKILFGCAMGLMQGTVPVYISELAPGHIRGFLLSLFQFWIMFGSFVAACVLEGTSHVSGVWSWKGTVISQLPLGLLCLSLVIPLVPESPYYLVETSQLERAKHALLQLRGSEPAYNVEEDLSVIKETLENGRVGKSDTPSYLECFKGSDLRRTFLACLTMTMQHFLGYPLCGNYLAYFLTLSGVESSFTITLISLFLAMLAVIYAFTIIERVGRRPQFLFGVFSILPCLLCIGVLGFLKPTTAVLRGVSALCLIWSFLWYSSVGAVGWTYVGEISSSRLRPKTTSIAAMWNSVINMGWSIAIPYLVNSENLNLGPKAGLVFFAPSVFFAILAFFVMPETKGKSFQELDDLFQRRVSARKF